MYYNSSLVCTIAYTNSFGSTISIANTCTLETTMRLKITLALSLLNSIVYQLAIDLIILARTMSKPSDIYVKSYDAEQYLISSSTLTTPSNTNYNSVKVVTLSITTVPSQLNQLQAFTIVATPYNPFLKGDYFVIIVPNLYLYVGSSAVVAPANLSTNLALSICDTTQFYCSNYNSNLNQIKVE